MSFLIRPSLRAGGPKAPLKKTTPARFSSITNQDQPCKNNRARYVLANASFLTLVVPAISSCDLLIRYALFVPHPLPRSAVCCSDIVRQSSNRGSCISLAGMPLESILASLFSLFISFGTNFDPFQKTILTMKNVPHLCSYPQNKGLIRYIPYDIGTGVGKHLQGAVTTILLVPKTILHRSASCTTKSIYRDISAVKDKKKRRWLWGALLQCAWS